MNKLDSLYAAKFRILNDPELKQIVGTENGGCSGTTSCSGSCEGAITCIDRYGQLFPCDPFTQNWITCYYSSIVRQCVCG